MLKDDQAWGAILIAGLTAVAVGIVAGGAVQTGVALVLAVGPIVTAHIASGRQPAATRRPWRLFVWAASGFMLAAILRGTLDALGVSDVFPSPADAVVALSYIVLIAATYQFGSIRSAGRNAAAQLDGMIVAVAAAAVIWAVVLAPYMGDATVPINERVINGAFSFLMTLALATTTRLAVSPGARNTGYYLLAAAVGALFLNDILVTLATVSDDPTRWSLVLGPIVSTLFSSAALHPHSPRLLDPPSERVLQLTRRRITLLAAALLIVPGLIVWAEVFDRTLDIPVLVVASVVLTGLVLGRVTMLARTQERAVKVQRIQREANADLASATSRHSMQRATLRAALRLVGDRDARVSMAHFVDDSLRVVDAVGVDADQAIGTSIGVERLPDEVAIGLAQITPSVANRTSPFDVGPNTELGQFASILVAPLSTQSALSGALIVTTAQPVALTVRQSIETLASTASLALESATLTENLLRRRTERRFRALVENSSDIVLVVNEDRFITFASPAAHRLLGLAERTLIGTHPARWVHPDDWAELSRTLDEGTSPARPGDTGIELRIRHVDGGHRWFEVRTKDLRHDVEIDGLVVTAREISDRKRTEQRLAESEARFRALVQNSTDVVAVVDGHSCYSYVSPAVTELLGFTPDELEGTPAFALLTAADAEVFRASYPSLTDGRLTGKLRVQQVETRVRHRSGEIREVDITLSDMRHEPAVGGIVLNVRDVTVRKALERDLHYQSLHDTLTGLANRAMFTQQAALALRTGQPHGATIGALVIDIDDFKTVNDSLGHAVGDELLKEVANRLAANLSTTDLAARLGGDEFAVLVVDAISENAVVDVADHVLDLVAQPFRIGGREIRVTCSIGIAVAAGEAYDAEVLLRSADAAMYLAKDRGKARSAMYEDHLHTSMFERLELKADLVRAIDDGELRCHYQPIVSLQTGQITGLEALVRWEHPRRGLLAPDSFIGLAEDTGLIVPLGNWVLREACHQLRRWQMAVASGSTLTMSVNLSVRQLAHESIVRDVRAAINDAGIDATTLTLEITESTLMHDTKVNRERLSDLRDLGLSLAVDDFGTGYSSLQYVQRFPIDIIKIDRSFVTGLGVKPGDGVVVQSMIELAQRLGVHTVAEGIDRPDQVALLQSLGADLAQGFLFSPPVPADKIDSLLAASPHENPRFLLR